MANLDSTQREDLRLQADPVLKLSDGPATFGLRLFASIAAVVVVLGTLYGLVHQGGSPPSPAIFSGAAMPDTIGQAK